MNYAVSVSGLRVARGGREVLHDIDCAIPAGSVTGLLGPSGCGKTTLLRAVMGVQLVSRGEVTVLGRPAGSRHLRDRIGYATQSPAIYPDLTVREALRYFAAVLRAPVSEVDTAISEVGLDDHADSLVARLSGGQRNRTNLAVALLGGPELLVLDEPTVGLDPVLRDELWDLFRARAREGTTLLVSSHVMDEAARCDRLVLLRGGEVLAEDTPDRLRTVTDSADLERAFLRLVRGREVAER